MILQRVNPLQIIPVMASLVAAEAHLMPRSWTGGGKSDDGNYEQLNLYFGWVIVATFAAISALLFLWKTSIRINGYIRRLVNLNNDSQRYFVSADPHLAWFKKHLEYAPLFRTRHHRELQLSRAVNMGILPSRLQSLAIAGLVALNITLCVIEVPFNQSEATAAEILRNRTGCMVTANLIPLVILAGRNNPLIPLLGISFDTWNLFHRWLARIVVLEALAHVIAWMVPKVDLSGGWSMVGTEILEYKMIRNGFVAVIAMIVIVLQSFSALRHAFYEIFLHLHLVLIAVAFAFLWLHLDGLPQQAYLMAAIGCWIFERSVRVIRIFIRNIGRARTTATVVVVPGDAMRINLKMSRPWEFKPGQHLYLYIPSVSLWMSHPFSVAWSEAEDRLTDEKGLVMSQPDITAMKTTTMSLLVRRRTGFTDSLYQRALDSPNGNITLRALVEGPYGNIHSCDSYGTVLLFAGGVGISHQVPYVRHLIAGYANGTVATRRVTLVWILQSPEHLEWIRPWMTAVLGMEQRREILRIMLFITRPRNTKEIHSPSATVQMYPGRPNIDTLIDMEIERQIGAMGVMVCGTGSLSDDVRRACRKRQTTSSIDFLEESFSW